MSGKLNEQIAQGGEKLHTPTPWYIAGTTVCTTIPDKRGDNVASCCHRENPAEIHANAAFILEACNSYHASQQRIQELEKMLGDAVALIDEAAEPDQNPMAAEWDRVGTQFVLSARSLLQSSKT